MAADKLSLIIDRLLARSRTEEIPWEVVSENEYATFFTNSSLSITLRRAVYLVRVLNDEGEIIQSETHLIGSPTEELFELIRDQSKRVSETLDDILRDLE